MHVFANHLARTKSDQTGVEMLVPKNVVKKRHCSGVQSCGLIGVLVDTRRIVNARFSVDPLGETQPRKVRNRVEVQSEIYQLCERKGSIAEGVITGLVTVICYGFEELQLF